jgi:dihydrodipicolinate synthase/N-acetylneuraminate lyase
MSYTFVPTYGVTGYTSGTYTQTTYSQFAIIEAFDSSDAEQPSASQVWRVDLESIGQRNDLRQGLPIMLAAAMPYIGSNSGQKLELELDEDDDAVQFLKGIAVR